MQAHNVFLWGVAYSCAHRLLASSPTRTLEATSTSAEVCHASTSTEAGADSPRTISAIDDTIMITDPTVPRMMIPTATMLCKRARAGARALFRSALTKASDLGTDARNNIISASVRPYRVARRKATPAHRVVLSYPTSQARRMASLWQCPANIDRRSEHRSRPLEQSFAWTSGGQLACPPCGSRHLAGCASSLVCGEIGS